MKNMKKEKLTTVIVLLWFIVMGAVAILLV